jgi:hypothetical protein
MGTNNHLSGEIMEKQEVFILNEKTLSKIVTQILETKEKVIALVTIRTLINLFNTGKLAEYENNRSGYFDENRCDKMVEKFNLNGIGSVTASISKKSNTLMQLDFHHRMEGIIRKNDLAELTMKELDTLIPITIFHYSDAISTYQTINAAKGHTGKEKINNPDLAIGSIIESILKKVDVSLDKKHSQNLMDVIFAYKEKGSDMNLPDIFASRNDVNELLDTAKDRRTFSISAELEYQAAIATKKYDNFKTFINLNLMSSANTKKAVKKPGFFIAFISDCLTNSKLFGLTKDSHEEMLAWINKRPEDVIEVSELIARRSLPKIIEAKQRKPTGLDIYKVLRNRSK